MTRKNFPQAVKVACIRRATRDNVIYCEGCGLPTRRFQIDHVDPDGLTGQPILSNARLLCDACHGVKTKKDVGDIARAKRQEARSLGLRKPSTLKGRGFPMSDKQAAKAAKPAREMPPRRPMFVPKTKADSLAFCTGENSPFKPKAKPAEQKKAAK